MCHSKVFFIYSRVCFKLFTVKTYHNVRLHDTVTVLMLPVYIGLAQSSLITNGIPHFDVVISDAEMEQAADVPATELQPEGGEPLPERGEPQPEGGELQPGGGEPQPEGGELQPEGGELQPEGGEPQQDTEGKFQIIVTISRV